MHQKVTLFKAHIDLYHPQPHLAVQRVTVATVTVTGKMLVMAGSGG